MNFQLFWESRTRHQTDIIHKLIRLGVNTDTFDVVKLNRESFLRKGYEESLLPTDEPEPKIIEARTYIYIGNQHYYGNPVKMRDGYEYIIRPVGHDMVALEVVFLKIGDKTAPVKIKYSYNHGIENRLTRCLARRKIGDTGLFKNSEKDINLNSTQKKYILATTIDNIRNQLNDIVKDPDFFNTANECAKYRKRWHINITEQYVSDRYKFTDNQEEIVTKLMDVMVYLNTIKIGKTDRETFLIQGILVLNNPTTIKLPNGKEYMLTNKMIDRKFSNKRCDTSFMVNYTEEKGFYNLKVKNDFAPFYTIHATFEKQGNKFITPMSTEGIKPMWLQYLYTQALEHSKQKLQEALNYDPKEVFGVLYCYAQEMDNVYEAVNAAQQAAIAINKKKRKKRK
jgi:hypothetical protein